MLVHVNAWQYDTGGGFEWFPDPAAADIAFAAEQQTEEEMPDVNWTAFRFDMEVKSSDPESITSEVAAVVYETTI